MKNLNTIGQDNLKYYYRSKNLPHKYDINKPIFITFRLKSTLPKSILQGYSLRKNEWNKKYQSLSETDKQRIAKVRDYELFCCFDDLLANAIEIPQLLHREDITDIIANALRFFDHRYYELLTYCIMPNHVHVMIIPVIQSNGEVKPLAHITYSWKKYTANQINKILNRRGSFWQHESYDHLIRNDNAFYHTLEYIIDNPVKAGLVKNWEDWYGTWIKKELKPEKVEQDSVLA
jgi:putative transposase